MTADESLTSSNTFTLGLLDKAKEMATTLSPPIRPINATGRSDIGDYHEALAEGKYIAYLHPYQWTDLKSNTSTGQWLDITKAAATGDGAKNNPIWTGAVGVYNNIIIKIAFDVTTGCNSSTSAAISTVRRAVLLGAQAGVIGYGMKHAGGKYLWNEELEISSVAAQTANENRVNSGKLLAA